MQNYIRKLWNNTLASPVYEIKSNLGKIAHLIVRETPPQFADRTCHRKIDIELFSVFHHSDPIDNRA